MLPTVLQSTTPSVLPATLRFGNVGVSAGAVDQNAPLDLSITAFPELLKYEARNQDLARIDLLLATLVLKTSYTAREVWGGDYPVVGLDRLLDDSYSPLTSAATPALIPIPNNPVPADFIPVGVELEQRDAVLFEALARVSKIFPSSLRQLTANDLVTVGDEWAYLDSEADSSALSTYACYYDRRYSKFIRIPRGISPEDVLDKNLFKLPDVAAIQRDNVLATWIGQLNATLLNVYASAKRLYVRSQGSEEREPEIYVLTQEDALKRVFTPDPQLPGNRFKLTYDKVAATLQWTSESPLTQVNLSQGVSWGLPEVSATNPLEFLGPVNGQTLSVLAQLPAGFDPDLGYGRDSQWYRQKSKRLNFLPSKYLRKYWQTTDFTVSPGVDSEDILHPSIEAGDWEFSFRIKPTVVAVPYSIPTECSPCRDSSISATCTTPDSGMVFTLSVEGLTVHTTVSLIANREDVIRFRLNIPQSFSLARLRLSVGGIFQNVTGVLVKELDSRKLVSREKASPSLWGFSGWNRESLDRASEGIRDAYGISLAAYPLSPEFRVLHANSGAEIRPTAIRTGYTQANYQCDANSNVVTWDEFPPYAVGDAVVFTSTDHLPALRRILSQSTTETGTTSTLNAILAGEARSGSSWQERAIVFSTEGLPSRLTVDDVTGIISGVAASVITPTDYTVVTRIRGDISGDSSIRIRVFTAGQPSPLTDTPYEWDQTSTEKWMDFIQTSEPRLRTVVREHETQQTRAFRRGKPGDIGFPCLIPSVLQYFEDYSIGHYEARKSLPVIRTFQPWMLAAGIYVVQDDWDGELPADCDLSSELDGCVTLAGGTYAGNPFANLCSQFEPNPRKSDLSLIIAGPEVFGTTNGNQFVTPWTVSTVNGFIRYAPATSSIPPFAAEATFTVVPGMESAVIASYVSACFDVFGDPVVATEFAGTTLVQWNGGTLSFPAIRPSLFSQVEVDPVSAEVTLYYMSGDHLTLLARYLSESFAVEHALQDLAYPVSVLQSSSRLGVSEVLTGLSDCGKIMVFTSTAYTEYVNDLVLDGGEEVLDGGEPVVDT